MNTLGYASVLLVSTVASVSCGGTRTRPGSVPAEEEEIYDIAAFGGATCVSLGTHAVWCWGRDFRDEPSLQPARPERVSVLENARVAVGGRHACALDRDGRAYCWGERILVAPQRETGSDRLPPTRLPFPEPVDQVALGAHSTCALLQGGDLKCLGLEVEALPGFLIEPNVPGRISKVSVGVGHACALTSSGHTYCWGRRRPYNPMGTATANADAAVIRVQTAYFAENERSIRRM